MVLAVVRCRAGMDRVRDLVAAGGVGMVLAQRRDRFAREPAYHYLLRKEFEEHSCVLRALNDRGDDSPEGELTDGIIDQIAKFERAKTAERTRRGRLRKAREGKIVAIGGHATYGFKNNALRDGYIVEEKTMPTVGRVFTWSARSGCRSTVSSVLWKPTVSRHRTVADSGTLTRYATSCSRTATAPTRMGK